MADLTECYSEFIKNENFLNLIIKIFTFSFFPKKILFGYEKYTFLALSLYFCATSFSALSYLNDSMLESGIIIMVAGGVAQDTIKTLIPLFNENELHELLYWIRELHKDNTFNQVTKSAATHFKKINFIITIFQKVMFTAYFTAASTISGYAVYSNFVIHAIPWIPVKENEPNIYHRIHQAFVLPFISIQLTSSECILVTILFYFIAIQNVFHDMVGHLDDSNLKNKKQFLRAVYIFHCEILKKFRIFSDICFYSFTIQTGSNCLYIMFMFYVLRVETNIIFIPLFMAIYLQFGLSCILGEFIYSKSENIFTDLYLTKWYEFDLSDQRVFLMMMRVSQYPFGFKAAGIYDINIVMFIQVIKAGLSFSAILYTFT
uniref:Odorant receptor n=1 Tax=Phlebotomus papatasi TaxID=29031 RepID=A0A1B0GPZ6_PHLPP